MIFLASRGLRCIAHDRRGHGRSSQPWNGNDMDTSPDDLAAPVEALDLNNEVHVGHSTGDGEVARYIGRHGTKRVAKAVLIDAGAPLMLKTFANPGRLPIEVSTKFAGMCSPTDHNISRIYLSRSTGLIEVARKSRKDCAIHSGFRECKPGTRPSSIASRPIRKLTLTEDLKKFDIPTLIMHGDDYQIVPIGASAMISSKIVKGSTVKVYSGLPHGMCSTRKDQINADLFPFIQA
jgi:non-heme chloroperoxidase